MEWKLNIPLIGRLTATFSKSEERKLAPQDTSETSLTAAYYYKKVALERTRKACYGDYRLMDESYVEISAALDLYSDNAAKDIDDAKGPFTVTAEESKVQTILDEMIDRTLMKEKFWDTVRSVAKMGDEFDEVVVDSSNLVVRLKTLEPEGMRVDRDAYGRDVEKPFVQVSVETDMKMAEFFSWQILHWKNGGTKRIYGDSILRPIRRVYKQLQLMEDGMVIGRLARSHMRLAHIIDCEGMSPDEQEDHLETVKTRLRKKRLINPYTNQLDTEQNPMCLTGDTKVPLLDGRELTILELMNEVKEGDSVWVYSCNGTDIVPGKATRPWRSGIQAEVVKVLLDNGESIKCTPDHQFMLRDGSWRKARELSSGDSLMPLYRKVDEKGYELVYPSHAGTKFEYTHRIVAKHTSPEVWKHTKLRTTHHANFNRRDNRPQNLPIMSWWDHKKLHIGLLETTFHSPEGKEKSRRSRQTKEYRELRSRISKQQWKERKSNPEMMERYRNFARIMLQKCDFNKNSPKKLEAIRAYNKLSREEKSRIMTEYNKSLEHRARAKVTSSANLRRVWENEEFRKRKSEQVSRTMKALWKDPVYRERILSQRKHDERGRILPLVSNHRVISVESCGREDVYDLLVENFHCLAVSAGVIVHNSPEEDIFLAVTKDSRADVKVIEGSRNLGNIRDVEYFQNKLFSGLAPKAYFGVERDVNAKSTLTEEDIQFARRIGRIRKAARHGIESLCDRQLVLLGEVPRKGLYEIKFAPISIVDEMRKWTMELIKSQVAKIYRIDIGVLTDEYILREFLGIPEDEIPKLIGNPEDKAMRVSGSNGKDYLALRQAGLVGSITPPIPGTDQKKAAQEWKNGGGFHDTLRLISLVEQMRDLISM